MDFLRHRPRYHAIPDHLNPRDVPENLWVKCSKCHEQLYVREFEKSFKVCNKCGNHFQLTAQERIRLLVDEGSIEEIATGLRSGDPLGFVDSRSYPERMSEARRQTGLD